MTADQAAELLARATKSGAKPASPPTDAGDTDTRSATG
jgi:hypothetical protein